jgi:dTDP-4-amino-4,6-dideoxygalactose transaminase
MDALRELADSHDLALLEDAAQAWGAEYKGRKAGALGDAATFSFFPTKNLPCFGDGGLIATNSDAVNETVRKLRFHGSKDKKVFELVGYNSRLDEIQAAILRRLISEVDGWNAGRQRVADAYAREGLGEFVTLPVVADGRTNIYHLYVVRTHSREHRAALSAELSTAGIANAVYYDPASHLQPVFTHLGWSAGDLPVTETLSADALALPMFATMTDDQVAEVVAAVRQAAPVAAGA